MSPTTLLLVTTRPESLGWLSRSLAALGHEVIEADSLEQACEYARTARFAAAIVDADDSQATREANDELGRVAGLPVVVLTACGGTYLHYESQPEFGLRVLLKPCDVGEVMRALEAVVEEVRIENVGHIADEAAVAQARSELLVALAQVRRLARSRA